MTTPTAPAVARQQAELLLDNIATATQRRSLLVGDPAEDKALTEAILDNAEYLFSRLVSAPAVQEEGEAYSDAEMLKHIQDAEYYGVGFLVDGLRVHPERVQRCEIPADRRPPSPDMGEVVEVLRALLGAIDEVGVRHWDKEDNSEDVEDVIFCSDRARSLLAKLEGRS